MELVDTETPNPNRFARTPDGAIDFDAYRGHKGSYRVESLDVEILVLEARQRFGHLDLLITPVAGNGERWTELKNITLHDDPALQTRVPVTNIAVEEGAITALVTAPVMPSMPITGTHWTEVAPSQDIATSEEPVVETSATDTEAEIAAILGGSIDSPNLK